MKIEELKQLKNLKRITFNELSRISGVPKRTLEDIFSGKTERPRVDTMEAIESALGVYHDSDHEISAIGGFPLNDFRAIPLVGQVVAGRPVESQENLEGYIYVDYKNADDYFALRVKGESMINAHIFPNSILIVKKQNFADNGDIIVASIDGESTVKRYHENGDTVVLMPENSAYMPVVINSKSNFVIFGKVVEIRQKI